MISFAQNAEDVVLARLFGDRATGTWIDVGAAHPVDDSVTQHFAQLGWTGINIEPNPQLHQSLVEARPQDINIQAAASDQLGSTQLWVGAGADRFNSTVLETIRSDEWASIEVPLVTVQQVAHEHGVESVDFLKIDVEGAEAAVLRGADLNSLAPRVLVIEAIHPRTRQPTFSEWEYLVIEAGYQRALFDGINAFYASADDEEALRVLSVPANALDEYVPMRWESLASAHGEAERYATSLEQSRAESEQYAKSLEARAHDAEQYARSLEVRLARLGDGISQLAQSVEKVLADGHS